MKKGWIGALIPLTNLRLLRQNDLFGSIKPNVSQARIMLTEETASTINPKQSSDKRRHPSHNPVASK
jgi:hypothetical protein